jgi:hypothetical protein
VIDGAYSAGVVALDVSTQPIEFDNVRVGFGVSPLVSIVGIRPASGPAGGGTMVEITGSGFAAGTTVTIGGAPASDMVVNSSTSLSAMCPAGVEGPADVAVENPNGTATLVGGFTYLAPGSLLFQDDFDDGDADDWSISPLDNAAGWNVVNGAFVYDGGGHTQAYTGDGVWDDYTLVVAFLLFSLKNNPGGIRGRVDPATGAGYTLWLYPATGQIKLYRATAWNIDAPGLTQLGVAGGIGFDAKSFHSLRLEFNGTLIEVYYDDALVIRVIDGAYSTGVVALDVSNQPIEFDDVVVHWGLP